MPAHGRNRGFTLLEVIAAIAILSIAFAALMKVAGSSMALTARADERTQAALRARTLLDSAFVLDDLKEGSSEGRFDDTYRWRLDVAAYTPPDAPADTVPRSAHLFQLDLDVMWGPAGSERHARFSTLRLVGIPPDGQPP